MSALRGRVAGGGRRSPPAPAWRRRPDTSDTPPTAALAMTIATSAACARCARGGRPQPEARPGRGHGGRDRHEAFGQRRAIERAIEQRRRPSGLPDRAQQDARVTATTDAPLIDGHRRAMARARDRHEQDGQHQRLHRADEARTHAGADAQQAAALGVFLDERPHVEPAPAADGDAEVAVARQPSSRSTSRAGRAARSTPASSVSRALWLAQRLAPERRAAPSRRRAGAPTAPRRASDGTAPSTARA